MKKRIALLNNISSVIYSVFPGERYDVGAEVQDPHGLILRSADLHDMQFGESLLAIGRSGAGYNNIPVDRCTEEGICVFNTPGGNANAVKELVLASTVMGLRSVLDGIEWCKTIRGTEGVAKQVEKGKKQFVGGEVKGRKIGVVGLGAIGAMVANDAYSMGLDVYGFDPFMSVESAWSLRRHTIRANSLEQLVSQCDIITLHIPLMDKTRGIINEQIFAQMKKGALLLNFARNELVDNYALKQALADGVVSKYITDFPNEQTLEMENVINIPHLGASTPESEENCADMAARQLYDYLQTGNIRNSVNLPACELPPYEGGRITFIHQNIPNMVGQITAELATENVNIAHMNNRSRGDVAYTMIDIDNPIIKESMAKFESIEGMIRVRVIKSAY